MIFVTAGNDKPFDRLVRKLSRVSHSIDEEIIVHTRTNMYVPANLKIVKHLTHSKFIEYLDKSRVIVSHVDLSIVLNAILKSKPIILFPRVRALRECRDDIQDLSAYYLEYMRLVYVARDESTLKKLLMNKNLLVFESFIHSL